jgi:hypothetical protein
VSTLIYTVREDWSKEAARLARDRRRVNLALLLVACAIGPGVFLVDRLAGTVAWRSFLSEALSLCLYGAVAVWYALRRSVRTVWLAPLLAYLGGLGIMGLTNLITKRGLSALLVNSTRANEPILWAGALMLLFVPLFVGFSRRYPIEMNRIGLFGTQRLRQLWLYSLVGLGVGLLIGAHFWLTAKSADIALSAKPWPYMIWQLFYEIGPQSLPEELLLRGVVFNELYFGRSWGFWAAALVAAGMELLGLLVKQDYSGSLVVIVGVVFYTVVSSVASAGLFRWSSSIVPGYVNNVAFSVIATLR